MKYHKMMAEKILNDLEVFISNDGDFLPVINFDSFSDKERIDNLNKQNRHKLHNLNC